MSKLGRHKSKRSVIQTAIDRDCYLWMIALNREFGFGKERLLRCKETVQQLYIQYADALQTDFDYGDEIIDREIRKIMGEESKSEIHPT